MDTSRNTVSTRSGIFRIFRRRFAWTDRRDDPDRGIHPACRNLSVRADDTPPLPGTGAEPVPPMSTQPEGRTVYLPYRNLAEVLKQHGATAIVPDQAYLKMIDEAERVSEPKVPVDAVITQAAYRGVVDGDVARITAVYDISVIGAPWVELPFNFGDAAIGKIDAGGQRVLLRGLGDGKYALLLGEAGDVKLTVELVTAVRTSPDGREFSLSVPPVGISTFEVVVPEKEQSIRIPEAIVDTTGSKAVAVC